MVIYIYQGSPTFFNNYILPYLPFSALKLTGDFFSRLYQVSSAFFLFFLLPLLIVRVIFKDDIKDYGLQLGDTLFGKKFLSIAIPAVIPFIFLASLQNDFQKEYPLPLLARQDIQTFILWEVFYFFYYIGWEFFFRGFLLLGIKEKVGIYQAILFQTIPSTIIHIGKPQGETLSAIIAGLIFGGLAIRTNSIIYPLILHYIIGIMMDIFVLVNR